MESSRCPLRYPLGHQCLRYPVEAPVPEQVPAAFPGTSLPPLDCLIMNVGTHAYESHWAAKHSFHW